MVIDFVERDWARIKPEENGHAFILAAQAEHVMTVSRFSMFTKCWFVWQYPDLNYDMAVKTGLHGRKIRFLRLDKPLHLQIRDLTCSNSSTRSLVEKDVFKPILERTTEEFTHSHIKCYKRNNPREKRLICTALLFQCFLFFNLRTIQEQGRY